MTKEQLHKYVSESTRTGSNMCILAIEKLTALSGDHPEYLGWVAIERVLNQKPS